MDVGETTSGPAGSLLRSVIRLVGMMTQHCVTHTALSPEAAGLAVTIVGAACAAPMAVLSDVALSGLAGRCTVV